MVKNDSGAARARRVSRSPAIALRRLLDRGAGHVHCLGIGGVGVAGLAFLLKNRGWQVSGCDNAGGGLCAWLKKQGLRVYPAHSPRHVRRADWLIRSTAVPVDHPELQAARYAGIPVFQRGQVLAELARSRFTISVCGTHGKTTTTAMIIHILRHCGVAPDFCLGGECAAWEGVAGVGSGQVLVIESDESDGTLGFYSPDITVLTNIEFDHAEYYRSLADLRKCFRKVLRQTRQRIVYCGDDPEATALCAGLPAAQSYGFDQTAAWRGRISSRTVEGLQLRLRPPSGRPVTCALPVTGRHNAWNALAACAAVSVLQVAPAAAAHALASFVPVRRRFEYLLHRRDICVVSDYAHHPTAVRTVLAELRQMPHHRWRIVFQAHRFSRTRALAADFAKAFSRAPVHELLLAPIYAASEKTVAGGTLWDLYAAFRTKQPRLSLRLAGGLEHIRDYLDRVMAPGDGLLILGAGDVDRLADWAAENWRDSKPQPGTKVIAWARQAGQLALPDGTRVIPDQPLAGLCTLRVGGQADLLADVQGIADLGCLMRWTESEGIPVTILGGGSNVLISDLGVRGLVLRLKGRPFLKIMQNPGGLLQAGAGVRLDQLVQTCGRRGWGGLEFLRGIPGTLGGALRMNAGAWNQSIGGRVRALTCMDRCGNVHTLSGKAVRWAYRRAPGLENLLVLEALLRIDPADPRSVTGLVENIDRRRRAMQWWPSAGSVFRNPPGDFAGRLLEQAGCKGMQIGRAAFTSQHANVIVTRPPAPAGDVLGLINLAAARVRDRFNVELEPEIVYCE